MMSTIHLDEIKQEYEQKLTSLEKQLKENADKFKTEMDAREVYNL